jgi:glutathionylspermidine synthase
MVHDTACGMGVREDDALIISNRSRFLPHIFN